MKTIDSIKTTYHDALFFASAPSNKKENFYLTPSEFKVLIKLMMYQRKNEKITYQNKTIAEHIFLAETTVKDAMEALARMGYISTELDVFNNGIGFKSKRIIKINWKRIIEIDGKLQQSEEVTKTPIKIVKVDVPTPVIKNKVDAIDLKNFNVADLRELDSKYIYSNCLVSGHKFNEVITKLNNGSITYQQMIVECDELVQKQLSKYLN